MFRSWFLQLLDEVAANFLLHHVLWHRRRPSVRGPTPAERPALYSGDLDAFFAPTPSPVDLAADHKLLRKTNTAIVRDYRFASETATAFPENDRVWCRHWQTQLPDRGLTVIGVDGIVQLGTTWFRRLAKELNPRGIDVLAMDAPFNFRRTPAGYRPGQLIVGGDMGHQLAVVRQAVLDLWQVIVTIQSEGRRVGLVGVSYGGWITLLASLLADNLEFLIAVVPPVDIVRMLREGGTMVRAVRRGIGRYPFDRPELERVARPVIPGCWPTKLSGEKISLHAARYDRLAPCCNIESLSREWGTRLVLHSAGHFHLANSPRIFPEMAEEICALAEC